MRPSTLRVPSVLTPEMSRVSEFSGGTAEPALYARSKPVIPTKQVTVCVAASVTDVAVRLATVQTLPADVTVAPARENAGSLLSKVTVAIRLKG